MRTSIGIRLSAASLAAVLLTVSLTIPVHADEASRTAAAAKKLVDAAKPLVDKCKELQDAANAAQKAADDAQKAADDAQKAADDAKKAADDAKKAAGDAFAGANDASRAVGDDHVKSQGPEDEAAAAAADAAEKAAWAAEAAQAEAEQKQKAADDAAKSKGQSGGDGKEGDKSDEQKAADAAKEKADASEKDAKDKEGKADAADDEAARADDKAGRDPFGLKDKARGKRKAARAAGRKASSTSRASDTKKAESDEKQAEADAKQREADAAKAEAAAALLAAKKPCDDAKGPQEAADKALDEAEEAIDKKINRSGKTPNKKDLEDKEKIIGWREDMHPKDKVKTNEPPKTVEPPAPGIMVASSAGDVRAKTGNDLHTVTFDTLQGIVTVNLPDDIRVGDTISGTVFTEPKGNTAEEKAKNQSELGSVVLDLAGTRIMAGRPSFTWTTPANIPQTPVRYQLRIVEVLGNPTPATQSGVLITPNPAGANPADPTFSVPSPGQTGRPVTITGQFDGNSSNTGVTIQSSTATAQPAANLLILAESPTKMVFRSPTNVTGPTQITVNEGGRQVTLPYRSVGVSLSVPRTTLPKGDETIVTVTVQGLAGISRDVAVRLEKIGVVTMQGGDVQVRSIRPAEVQADGTFTMTRTITGQQAGAFTVTATVLPTR